MEQLGLRCPSKELSDTWGCHGKLAKVSGSGGQISQEEYSPAVGTITEPLVLLGVNCLFRPMLGVGGERALHQEVRGNLYDVCNVEESKESSSQERKSVFREEGNDIPGQKQVQSHKGLPPPALSTTSLHLPCASHP